MLPADIPEDASNYATLSPRVRSRFTLDLVFLAGQQKAILLSEDMYFRQNAATACNVRLSIWLQPALNFAKRRELSLCSLNMHAPS